MAVGGEGGRKFEASFPSPPPEKPPASENGKFVRLLVGVVLTPDVVIGGSAQRVACIVAASDSFDLPVVFRPFAKSRRDQLLS